MNLNNFVIKSTLSFVCLAVSLVLLCSTAHASPGSTSKAPLCSRIKSQRDTWVAQQIDALVRVARAAYESDDALEAYDKTLDRITETIDRCELAKDKYLKARYRSFLDYLDTISLERLRNHELGFAVSDEFYFSETQRYVEIPAYLLDPSFLRFVSRFETLPQAKEYLRRINSTRNTSEQLIFFSYKSRHLGTPDNDRSFRRLLIVVPGDSANRTPEKWVQFGVTDPGARTRVRNVSIVAALPGPEGAFDVYFKDFYRTYRPDGSITVKGRWELGEGDDNCAQCHKSGVLPIFPAPGSVSDDEQPALLAVNERFRSYGTARFGRYLDPVKLGPGLGSSTSQDRETRYGIGFNDKPYARAMICASCHRADRLGALAWPMDKKLIKSYVTGGQMPFGYQLELADRHELYARLIQEYFSIDKNHPGILKSWLLGSNQ